MPDSTDYAFPPLNLKFQHEENDFIRFVAPNENGLIPYLTDLSPILLPPLVPDPLTFIGVQHNYLLGNQRLILAPPNRYGCTTFSALAAESAHRHIIAQQQPIVNMWNAAGTWSAVSTSSNASATSTSANASAAGGFATWAPANSSAASAFVASSFAPAFSGSSAASHASVFPTFTGISRARSPPSPLPMSEHESDEYDESDEDIKDENDERYGSALGVKEEERRDSC